METGMKNLREKKGTTHEDINVHIREHESLRVFFKHT